MPPADGDYGWPPDKDGRLVIPDTWTTIAYNAFVGCTELASVTIPDTVTSIGDEAFYECTGLTSVTIPSSVTSIGVAAFNGCTGLTSVTTTCSVTSIGNRAFGGCSRLTSMTIPSSVASIGYGAFYGCTGLTSVTIPSSVTSIGRDAFKGCSGLTSVTIPSSVTSISKGAFEECTRLTSVTIPSSVTSIGNRAFKGCTGLTSVTIPSSVTSIGNRSFDECTGLLSVMIPSPVTSISVAAFYGCSGLTSVTIPRSVTSIGDRAFQGCTGLMTVAIPSSVTSIGVAAFYGCTGLTSVTIPSSVTSIGEGAFEGCTGLTSVTIPSAVTSIGGGAFSGCTRLTSVTIPSSATSISDRAFARCSGLTSLTIPNSVTSIGNGAFTGCFGLTSMTIPSSVTSISDRAFAGCTGLTLVTVPVISTSIGGRAFEFKPREIFADAPDDVLAACEAEQLRPLISLIRMGQFSSTPADEDVIQTPVQFDAEQAIGARDAFLRHDLSDLVFAETVPAALFQPANPTPSETTTAAATTTARFQRMLQAQPQLPQPDTAPLSARLASLKDVLNICLQFELSTPSPSILNTVDFGPHMAMHVDPAIGIVKQELEVLKAQVASNPDKYRQLLVDLSTADRIIYDESFGKTIKPQHGGDKAAYDKMLQQCAGLTAGCTMDGVQVQPTSELMPLVLMVRANIPAFKEAVEATLARAAAGCTGSSSTAAPTTVYRPHDQPKAPYRIIEKSLTKGPNQEYPDCSKVLDVFGCLIDCADYNSMAAVVAAFAARHTAGELQLSRIKDRWSQPSAGGWRDLMLNVVINDVVFEVQVVLHAMLVARTALDAHKAYNQFRSFAEIFDLLDLDPEVSGAGLRDGGGGDGSTSGGEDGSGGAGSGIDAGTIARLRAELVAERSAHAAALAMLAAEREASAAERVAHAEEVARLRALLAEHAMRTT